MLIHGVEESDQVGLEINTKKTLNMKSRTSYTRRITFDDADIEEVEKFIHMQIVESSIENLNVVKRFESGCLRKVRKIRRFVYISEVELRRRTGQQSEVEVAVVVV